MWTISRFAVAAGVLSSLAVLTFSGESSPRVLIDAGNRSMSENRYRDAVESFRSAAALLSVRSDPVDLGISLDQLGMAYAMLGRHRDAERAYLQAISALETVDGEPPPALIATWIDFAGLLLKLKRYERARDYAERALEASHTVKAKAVTLALLATIDSTQRKNAEAQARCRQALTILDNAGLGKSYEWITAANNLALLLITAGKLDEGGQYLENALSRGEEVLRTGVERLILGQVLANLAQLDFKRRRFDEAEKNYRRALDVFDGTLGPHERLRGDILMQYAALCRATNRKAEAKNYEMKARKSLDGADPGGNRTVDLEDFRVGGGK